MLSVNKTNLEVANRRILDVDMADESTKLAQANQPTQSILRLIS
jgi:flagellin-like hook-associated protein FlgL